MYKLYFMRVAPGYCVGKYQSEKRAIQAMKDIGYSEVCGGVRIIVGPSNDRSMYDITPKGK